MGFCKDSGLSTGPISWMEVREFKLSLSNKSYIAFVSLILCCEGIVLTFFFGLEKASYTHEGSHLLQSFNVVGDTAKLTREVFEERFHHEVATVQSTQNDSSKFHHSCIAQKVFPKEWQKARTHLPNPTLYFSLPSYLASVGMAKVTWIGKNNRKAFCYCW